MNGNCNRCGVQPLRLHLDRTSRLAVQGLTNLLIREVQYACARCGEVIRMQQPQIYAENRFPDVCIPSQANPQPAERQNAHIWAFTGSPQRPMSLQYPSILIDGYLFPVSEGTVQDGTGIDRYGEPDMMARFAEEYLKQFWILIPEGRLPGTLIEIMPALLLLFTATELSLKAYFIRSETRPNRSHSLRGLYEELEPQHRQEIENRFLASANNLALATSRVKNPTVQDILDIYSETYGGGSNVYMDSRYYAEPTTNMRNGTSVHGENLLKSSTPYPIFLPQIARALIDTYWFFSGSARLRRMGADLQAEFGETGNDNPNVWGLVPSSLGLVVVVVTQQEAKNGQLGDTAAFRGFKLANPTEFIADWMYGGNTLLFYCSPSANVQDGEVSINGLPCRIRRNQRVGIHTRDTYRLADALERSNQGENVLGHLSIPVDPSAKTC